MGKVSREKVASWVFDVFWDCIYWLLLQRTGRNEKLKIYMVPTPCKFILVLHILTSKIILWRVMVVVFFHCLLFPLCFVSFCLCCSKLLFFPDLCSFCLDWSLVVLFQSCQSFVVNLHVVVSSFQLLRWL